MILSKLTTANNLEDMAAAEMSASATIRNSDEVFATVSGEMFDGSVYAFVAMATVQCTVWCRSVVVVRKRKEWDAKRSLMDAPECATCPLLQRVHVAQTPIY